ncbi:MAG: hypothetical protein IJ087_12400, partial [Eggerthellaceae bacterium]|nr:hypothetical protein [Eggerthellaceae bacterium]
MAEDEGVAKEAWELLKTTTWRTEYIANYSHISETRWRCDIELHLNLGEKIAAHAPAKVHVPIALLSKNAVHSDFEFKNESGCLLNMASRSQAATFVLQALDGALAELGEASVSGTGLGEALFYLFRQSSLLGDPSDPRKPLMSDTDRFAEKMKKAALGFIDGISRDERAAVGVWNPERIEEARKSFERMYDDVRIFRYFVQTYATKHPVYVVLEDESRQSKVISGGFVEYQGVARKGGLTRSGLMRFRSSINPLGRKFEKNIDVFGMAEHVRVTVKSPDGTHFAPVSASRGQVEMLYCSEANSHDQGLPDPQVRAEGSIAPSRVSLDTSMCWDLEAKDEPLRRMPWGNSLEQAYAFRVRLLPEYRGTFLSVLAFFFLSIVAMLFLSTPIDATSSGNGSSRGLQSFFVVAPIIMTTFLARRKTSYIERSVSWIQRGLFGAGIAVDLAAVVAYCWMNALNALETGVFQAGGSGRFAEWLLSAVESWNVADLPHVDQTVFLNLGIG